MSNASFKAMVLTQDEGKTLHRIEDLTDADLPEGDVLIQVDYSDLNFKDAMAVTGTGKIVRAWPMVPGIDLAGSVVASDSPDYKAGDKVLLTGWSVGERYWGGYTQRQRVKSEWLVPLPEGLDTKRAMAIGTAGFTGMLCVLRLEDADVTPESGTILVTGAAGGVGSVAVAILANLGYRVAALTAPNQQHTHDYLRELGAAEIITGDEWSEAPRPLEAQKWAAAIDTVGTKVLARVLASVEYGGVVASCGLAGGADLPVTVMPFILRNVGLLGVDSVMCPVPRRIQAWTRLVTDLPENALGAINRVASLAEVPKLAAEMMAGRIRGRVVIDVNA